MFFLLPALAILVSPVVASTQELTIDQMKCQLDPENKACFKHRGLSTTGGAVTKDWAPNTVNLTINFEYNSAILQTDARINLDRLGTALAQLEGQKFKIGGHTDSKGSANYNLSLSERRAKAVRDYLITKFNIPAGNLVAAGYGKTRPLFPDDPENSANRRVEVLNLTPTPQRD
jgi:outer membrane protein OmpA-like peptidoglycan-associated protein